MYGVRREKGGWIIMRRTDQTVNDDKKVIGFPKFERKYKIMLRPIKEKENPASRRDLHV